MDKNYLTLLAGEAFLRRVAAAQQDFPFMLKGSFLTRQYLPNPTERKVKDLDWVYIGKRFSPYEAGDIFLNWIKNIVQINIEDAVKFIIWDEKEIWTDADYAMADDYSTINIDLYAIIWLNGEEIGTYLGIDFTFDLEIELPPVSLLYKPVQGESFILKYTVPLALQIAWKLHQTIVRPRVKDIADLIHLLQHGSLDKQIFQGVLQALVNECHIGKVDIKRLDWFINDLEEEYFEIYRYLKVTASSKEKLQDLFIKMSLKKIYINSNTFANVQTLMSNSNMLDFARLLPLLTQFRLALNNAGFTSEILKNLPKPN